MAWNHTADQKKVVEMINKLIKYKTVKGLVNGWKNSNRVVDFRNRPLPNFLKYRDFKGFFKKKDL